MTAPRDSVSPSGRARVGVVGAGQLARMMLEAALPLGIDFRVLAERPDDSAALVSTAVSFGSPRSFDDLARFVSENDVTTFDHELVDADALSRLEREGHAIRPSAAVVSIAQDKRRQRTVLAERGLPIPPFRVVEGRTDLERFAADHGWPIVVKSARDGYDGRGVWVLATTEEARDFGGRSGLAAGRFVVERWVPIERELAVLVARTPSGTTASYPLVETVQREGICRELIVPARVSPSLATTARRLGIEIAEAIGVVGILAVELFESAGTLIVNELATRPHNSGHFTIEGCSTSQFQQHLRAVLDWPLGSTELLAPAVATVNVLGGARVLDPRERLPLALDVPGARVHLYGKEPRRGRKLGHVTVLADTVASALERARLAAARLIGESDEGERQ